MKPLRTYVKKALLVIISTLRLDVVLGKLGYQKISTKSLERPSEESDHHYVLDYYGKSSAKQIDIRTLPEFGPYAATVIQHGTTYLYYDRLFTIYQALGNYKRYGGKMNFAEVGVYHGGGSYFMALMTKNLGLSGASLYSFDTFEGHSSLDVRPDKDPYHRPKDFADTEYAGVKKYLEEFENVHVIKGRFQDTCSLVENEKFYFVHLDVDIYDPTLFALKFFGQCLEVGGAIVVDDYGFKTCPGVRAAVDEFVNIQPNYFFMELLTGQCILIRKN
jgi:O-methyltransferase